MSYGPARTARVLCVGAISWEEKVGLEAEDAGDGEAVVAFAAYGLDGG